MIYVEVLQLTDNFDHNLGGKRQFLHIPDFCQICPATDDSPLGLKRQRIEGRKERYIRVVISERGTGISFNAMQYFSKYKNTKVKNTRDDVAEADGGEGDEAEVEGVKEGPVSQY